MAAKKLEEMSVGQLQQRYAKATGQATRVPNKKWLVKSIQTAEAKARLARIEGTATTKARRPRRPAAAAAPSESAESSTSASAPKRRKWRR